MTTDTYYPHSKIHTPQTTCNFNNNKILKLIATEYFKAFNKTKKSKYIKICVFVCASWKMRDLLPTQRIS